MEQRCNVCYKVYPSMIELGIHLDYPYNCYLCDKSFALSGHLKNHTKQQKVMKNQEHQSKENSICGEEGEKGREGSHWEGNRQTVPQESFSKITKKTTN